MTAAEIEDQRKQLREVLPENVANELCELALDGLRFRFWIEMASGPGIVRLAKAIARYITPNQYRTAIDGLIVEEARRR